MNNKIIFSSLIILIIFISGCSEKMYYSKKSISYRLDYNSQLNNSSDYNNSLVYYCINPQEELITANKSYKTPKDKTSFVVHKSAFCPTSYMTLDMKNVKDYIDNGKNQDKDRITHFYQTAMTISDMNCENFKKRLLANDEMVSIFEKAINIQLFGVGLNIGNIAKSGEAEFIKFKHNLSLNLKKREKQGDYMRKRIKDGNYTSRSEFVGDLLIYDNQCNILDTNFTVEK